MNIDRISQKAIEAYALRTQRVSEKASSAISMDVGKSEEYRLSISEGARQLQQAQNAVESSPDLRAEKVAAIKKQVQAGTYTVSTRALADKLMSVLFND